MSNICNQITIIGMGLIGSSLARAIKKSHAANIIIAANHSDITLKKAIDLGICDHATTDLAESVKNSDIIILATPLKYFEETTKQIAPHIKDNAILTDVGSVKSYIINKLTSLLKNPEHFVPAHPIAGTEKSGIDAGFAELFEQRKTIITPIATTDHPSVLKIKAIWEACGSIVEMMPAEQHDRIYAGVSHLPQFLAYSFTCSLLAKNKEFYQHVSKANNDAFTRFLRIASSPPEIWTDIFLYNAKSLSKAINSFELILNCMTEDISRSPGAFYNRLVDATERRLTLSRGISTTEPNDANDDIYVTTYILPKLIALALIESNENISYSGSGFRDFTSGLLSIPENFFDICLRHHTQIDESIANLSKTINQLKSFIDNKDEKALLDALIHCQSK